MLRPVMQRLQYIFFNVRANDFYFACYLLTCVVQMHQAHTLPPASAADVPVDVPYRTSFSLSFQFTDAGIYKREKKWRQTSATGQSSSSSTSTLLIQLKRKDHVEYEVEEVEGMGGGGKSEVNGTHPSVCALLPRTTKRNLRKHSFIVCSVYSRNNPPAAKCLSARQTSTQSPQKPSPASVTIVTGHRCRPVLINVHGTPSCLIEVLLHPTRSPYGLKLRDSGRRLEF